MPNIDRVLHLVLEADGISRSALAERAGLSRSAVATLVTTLIANGQVREAGPQSGGVGSGQGRPSALLHPVLQPAIALGLDFGHKHVSVAASDLEGTTIGTRRVRFDVDTKAHEAIDLAMMLVDDILAEHGRADVPTVAAVASIPGPIDLVTGIVQSPTILAGWVGLDPAAEIAARLGTPVSVHNDANLGAWGERVYGAGRGVDDFVYIKASDGIGAGIIVDGRILAGSRGLAGEIGHTPSDAEGQLCRCGNNGCIEMVASSTAVRAKLAIVNPYFDPTESLASLTDSVSKRILAEAGRALGKAIADVCNLLNPSAVIIGGELGEAGDAFVRGVRESVDRIAQPATAATVEILVAETGRDAELMGALAKAVSEGRQLAVSAGAPDHPHRTGART